MSSPAPIAASPASPRPARCIPASSGPSSRRSPTAPAWRRDSCGEGDRLVQFRDSTRSGMPEKNLAGRLIRIFRRVRLTEKAPIGEVDAASALPAALERPIDDPAEDKLERAGFIRRLGEAGVGRNTKRATGVILGITGPWGKGKSAILNIRA